MEFGRSESTKNDKELFKTQTLQHKSKVKDSGVSKVMKREQNMMIKAVHGYAGRTKLEKT